jgi:hypothetical protein
MSKATSVRAVPHRSVPSWTWLVPTLGLYGLPRLRPRWKYTTAALGILAAWVVAGIWFALANPGTEPLVGPIIFVAAIVTMLRLARPR